MGTNKIRIFEIDSEALFSFNTLEEDDLGRWALMARGAIICFEDSEEDAEERKYRLENELYELGDELSFLGENQNHDDLDEHDEHVSEAFGGFYGNISFDNLEGEGIKNDWRD